MSMTIGLADAKARLSELISRVESGERILIARNGEPVAELRAIKPVSDAEMVERIRALAKRVEKRNRGSRPWPPDGQSLRDVAHERHRF
jgi:prevent-host-death family protein